MGDVTTVFLACDLIQVVAFFFKIENIGIEVSVFLPKRLPRFLLAPEVELSFLSLTVRIFSGIKSTRGRSKVPHDVCKRILAGIQKEGIVCNLVTFQVRQGKEGLVVEHLFEVGNEPFFISRITMKPKADVIIHASQPNSPKR